MPYTMPKFTALARRASRADISNGRLNTCEAVMV
jgi:hypothetical protein